MPQSLKSKTMAITGWSEAEYKKNYNRFAQQVRNFNRATGSNYSAARMFYNAQKEQEPSKALQGIMQTPATKAHRVGEQPESARVRSAAGSYVVDRFDGLSRRSTYVKSQLEKLQKGEQDVATTNRNIVDHINRAKLNAKADPGSYASALYD